jgi:RNA-directed DNA polymerase
MINEIKGFLWDVTDLRFQIGVLAQGRRWSGMREKVSRLGWSVVAAGHGPAVVRLRRQEDGAVEVRSCAVRNRAVSNRNCVAARRGGEQRNENDQSVTQAGRRGCHRELDSVGVSGRVCDRRTKPVTAGINPLAAGGPPVNTQMVGDGMAGSPPAVIRETRRGQAEFRAERPEEPPGGSQSVRSSGEAGNDRGAKGLKESGCVKNQNDEHQPAPVAATPPQAGETRARWGWVERAVWTERMLTRLTEGGSANRVWFRLADKTYAPANLASAFKKVWQNGGSAGADGQTVAHFARQADAELARLHEQLRDGRYRPQPVRRAWIPKPGSKEKRPLGIPAVRDRIVQAALRHVLEPIFETGFAEQSYGFRPGRGAKAALRRVDTLLKAGHHWVVDADLKSYFDTIPHERLMALVKTRVADGRVLALVESFLRAGVLEEHKGWSPTGRGTPQGGVISPLLANLYLDPFDQEMARTGKELVRYADDFVILCRSEAEAQAALAEVRTWVKEAGLSLHPEKTRIVNADAPGGFDFLGYHFERGMKWPRQKSLMKLKERIRAKTSRMEGRSLAEIVADVNRSLRGWYGYFQQSKSNTFGNVDGYVRRRLRSLLQWRLDGRGKGIGEAHHRWPNKWFAQRGLLSLTAEHEWTRTIVKLRTH